MEFTNDGTSVYHEIQALYSRSSSGQLFHIAGPLSSFVSSSWAQISKSISSSYPDDVVMTLPVPADHTFPSADSSSYSIRELYRPADNCVTGVLLKIANKSPINPLFRDWYVRLVLSTTRLSATAIASQVSDHEAHQYAESITTLFEQHLRNIAADDRWPSGGREFFLNKVLFYTQRMVPVEMALPAFPCKSSNTLKVAGVSPDKGEELGIRCLADFTALVKGVYPPGAKCWVVSDGHVFSDCIGVDDGVVDTYSRELIEMTSAIVEGDNSVIGFCGLEDLFFPHGTDTTTSFTPALVDGIAVKHHVPTNLTTAAETCRRVLIAGSQIDARALRAKIDGNDKATLNLYRGFARFMLDDLSLHPGCQTLGKNRKKKLASQVAFEMIIRNQAYSNLLELLMPVHVRLSIHAHNNAGPKFGISLLPKNICRTLGNLNDASLGSYQENTDDLLHLPTPWHNSVVQITNATNPAFYYVIKSELVTEALEKGSYTGAFIPGDGKAVGGYYSIQRVESYREPAIAPVTVSAMDEKKSVITVTTTLVRSVSSSSEGSSPVTPRDEEPVVAKNPSMATAIISSEMENTWMVPYQGHAYWMPVTLGGLLVVWKVARELVGGYWQAVGQRA